MPIDWFTVLAQAINFVILVWLLKRFLYKPILRAIDEREKAIATRLAEAEAKQAEAQKERDDFQHKHENFDQERTALMNKATDEAKFECQRLLGEARKDADSLRVKRQEALRSEQRNLSQDIIRWTQKEVFAVARKTLADLATTSLEERMGDVFVRRVRELTGVGKEQMANSLKTLAQPARVRSAFDLPPEQRNAIGIAVKDAFGTEVPLQFETVPELVSGIELSANGQKIAWSIADYLATLEKSAGELLREDAKSESRTDARAKPDANDETKAQPRAELKTGPNGAPKLGLRPVPSSREADH